LLHFFFISMVHAKSVAASQAAGEVKALLPEAVTHNPDEPSADYATPGKPVVPKRTMGAIKLGFVAFVAVCGGLSQTLLYSASADQTDPMLLTAQARLESKKQLLLQEFCQHL
jgi:hypothetical protein